MESWGEHVKLPLQQASSHSSHISAGKQCFLASLAVKFRSFFLSQMLGRLCCATSTFKVKCFDSVALLQ